MPIGLGSALWAYCAPIDAVNLAQNPSFEFGTPGVVAIQGATIGSTSQFQRYGAWSAKITPSSNGTSGALLGTYQVASGTTYSVSVWAFVEQGVPMRFGVGDQNGVNLQSNGTMTFTGGGTWQWYTVPALVEGGAATRGVVLQKSSGNSQLSYYVDGLMINPWTDSIDRQITYFDGDTNGGTWQGAQHQSISTRTGQYRGGGSIVALADLGLSVDQMLGVGVAPVENSAQSYAITDGAQFQRTRAATRKFTLTAKPIVGTSLADFHNTRRALWDAFKPDLVTPQQPVRLLYYGAQGTQQIDAYYDKGLELGNMDGPIAENAAVSFVSYDPYWYAPTQQGTTLAPRTAIGSTNFIARRSPLGKWGTLGANGTTVQYNATTPTIRALQFNSAGTLFLGGEFGSVGGTVYPHAGMYNPYTNVFGTLVGGTIQGGGGGLYALAASPSGTLFLGGQFNILGGTTTFNIGRWTGAFGTLQGGTLRGGVDAVGALLYSPTGTLILAGGFGTAGGTRAFNIAFWTGAYGTLTGNGGVGSAVGEAVNTLAWGLDNRIFIGGNYTNVGGTIGTSIGFYKNTNFGTMGNVNVNSIVNALGVGPNGVLYEAGFFSGISGATETNVAQWNGIQHSPMGSGLGNPALNELAHTMTVDQQTGNVYVGGQFTVAGGINVASNYAMWNGYTWILPDITISSPGTLWAVTIGPDRSLYIAGIFSGTAQVASVGTIINNGRAAVYPRLRLRNLSASGTARIYQLLNTTTNAGIYFNYVMQPGEQADLVLQPGARSFQSSAQGNILSTILPGSNLATFNLLPGTNYISHFADNDSLEASFFWQPKGWAADSGTVL